MAGMVKMEEIEAVIAQFGLGASNPVPYDTAWVAQIPHKLNSNEPAFPSSLDWLISSQLEDGSWESLSPGKFSPMSTTLNTLAAINALSRWNGRSGEFDSNIQNGIRALWALVPSLGQEKHEPIGFELILPSLVSQAISFGLNIPVTAYERYKGAMTLKLGLLKEQSKKQDKSEENNNCHDEGKIPKQLRPSPWHFSLEMLGEKISSFLDAPLEVLEKCDFFTEEGSVNISPSATAFYLQSIRLVGGTEHPKTEKYLTNLSFENNGGIPNVILIDNFEIAWGLDYLFKAGMSPRDPRLQRHLSALAKQFEQGLPIAATTQWAGGVEADSTAVALSVLARAGQGQGQGHSNSSEILLKFFTGEHMVTYPGERTPSMSVNIHTLWAFKNLKSDDPKVKSAMAKITDWISIEFDQNFPLLDKWNISPYYCTASAVFALAGLRDDLVQKSLDYFAKTQNKDGGWGQRSGSASTGEESAYVALAITFAIKQGFLIHQEIINAMKRFFQDESNAQVLEREDALWIGKVLYCPSIVRKTAILAAKYAIDQLE